MADPDIAGVASWIQTGGVLAFAGAVYLELRELRKIVTNLLVRSLPIRRDTDDGAEAE